LKNRKLCSRRTSCKAQDQSAIDRKQHEGEDWKNLPMLATISRLILWIVV
jgi:hypothetical protein